MRKNEKWADGSEILRITSNRDFSFEGVKYHVSNLPKSDAGSEGYKYSLDIVEPDGFFNPAHDGITWELLRFKTIKDARRWVRDWNWNIKGSPFI